VALNVRGSNSLFWKTGIDNTGLQQGSMKAKGILGGLASSITKMDVFGALAIGAAVVFQKMTRTVYKFSSDFEDAMLEVSTISKMVTNDYEGMSLRIIEMSRIFPEKAVVLTKALYQIVSAGYDSAIALDILTNSTKLATAAVTDTFTAADAVTSVMNAYGEAAGDAAAISDKLFTIVRLGKTTMRELGPEITTVTGLAAQAGLSFNELSAVVAESVKTLRTPIAMTGIRGILTAVMKPAEEAQQLISDLLLVAGKTGFEFNIAAARSMGFVNFLKEVMVLTKGDTELLAQLFPNIRGLTGLLSVATDSGDRLSRTLREIEDSADAVNEAFAKMEKSSTNKIKIMVNNVLADLKSFGDTLIKIAGETADEADSFLSTLRKISDAEIKMRNAGNDWYDDTYFYFEDLTKKALEYFNVIDKEPKSWIEIAAESARLEHEVRKIYLPETLKTGKKPTPETPESFAAEVTRRAALMREMIEITKSYEDKAAEIHKHYADLATVADGESQKKRLKYLESEEIKKLYESFYAKQIEADKKQREKREQLAQEYLDSQKKLEKEAYETTKTYQQKILDIRKKYGLLILEASDKQQEDRLEKLRDAEIKQMNFDKDLNMYDMQNVEQWSEKRLQVEIQRLSQIREMHKGNADEIYAISARTQQLQGLLDDKRVDSNKLMLDEIIKDTRKMNNVQIQEYIKTLNAYASAAKMEGNQALSESILGLVKDATGVVMDRKINQIKEMGAAFQDLGQFVGQFDYNLGSALDSLGAMISSVDDLKQAMDTGNIFGGISGGIGAVSSGYSLLSTINKGLQTVFAGERDSSEIIAEQYGKLIDRQEQLIRLSVGAKKLTAQENELILLNKALELQKSIDASLRGRTGAMGTRPRGGYLDSTEVLAIKQQIKELTDSISEEVTGTTTESIADSITEGFVQGLDSAKNFADTFEKLMSDALLSAFKSQMISKILEPFYTQFAELSKGGLTADEIKDLKTLWFGVQHTGKLGGTWLTGGLVNQMQDAWDAWNEIAGTSGVGITGTTGTSKTGLAGAIAGITEETAGLLAGQFNALLMNTVEIKGLVGVSNGKLQGIRNGVWDIYAKAWPLLDVTKEIRDSTSMTNSNISYLMSVANENMKANQETAVNTRHLKSIDAKLGGTPSTNLPSILNTPGPLTRAIGA